MVESTDVGTEVEVSKDDWNKEKQRADMEHANWEKANEAKKELEQRVSGYEAEVASLRNKLKVNESKIEISELDPLSADVPDLVKQNKLLIERVKQIESYYDKLQDEAESLKRSEQSRTAEKQKQAVVDKICQPLDKEFGAKYRTKAVAEVEAAVEAGSVTTPQDALDAYQLLLPVYKRLKAEDETKSRGSSDGIAVDTGGSSAFSFVSEGLKEGSLKDVVGQMRGAIGK
jgi:predicted  nucleic acid-binding Zn-ribbon protein